MLEPMPRRCMAEVTPSARRSALGRTIATSAERTGAGNPKKQTMATTMLSARVWSRIDGAVDQVERSIERARWHARGGRGNLIQPWLSHLAITSSGWPKRYRAMPLQNNLALAIECDRHGARFRSQRAIRATSAPAPAPRVALSTILLEDRPVLFTYRRHATLNSVSAISTTGRQLARCWRGIASMTRQSGTPKDRKLDRIDHGRCLDQEGPPTVATWQRPRMARVPGCNNRS